MGTRKSLLEGKKQDNERVYCLETHGEGRTHIQEGERQGESETDSGDRRRREV